MATRRSYVAERGAIWLFSQSQQASAVRRAVRLSLPSVVAEDRDNAICHTVCNTSKKEADGDPNKPFRTLECQLRYNSLLGEPLRHFRPTFQQAEA